MFGLENHLQGGIFSKQVEMEVENGSHAAAISERGCQGLVLLPGTPLLVLYGEGVESPPSPEGLEGPLRPRRRARSDLTAWGDQWRQGFIPPLPTFILFTLESNRSFPISPFLLDAIALARKLKLFEGGLIQRGFLLCSGSVDSAPGKPHLS